MPNMKWTRTQTQSGMQYTAGDPAACRYVVETYDRRHYSACAYVGYYSNARYVVLGEYRTLAKAMAAAESYRPN